MTTSTSGSDDDQIHCLKPGQPYEAGSSMLKDEMEKLLADCNAESDEDPFQSEEDEEQTEINEVIDEVDDADMDQESETSDKHL